MNKDEVLLLLDDNNLDWNDFLHYMSGKEMQIISDKGIVFPSHEVNKFVNKNNYYD